MKTSTCFALALLMGASPACNSGDEGGEAGNPALACEREDIGAPVLRRMTRRELRDSLVQVFPELGADWDDSALGPDPVSERGFSNDASLLTVGDQTAAELLATAEAVASSLSEGSTLASMLPCSQTTADLACAEGFITSRGRLLFHRELSADELASYRGMFQQILSQSDFPTGLRWTLVSLIMSPNFVYRFELGAEGSAGERELLPWEVATALAYTYSGMGPSAELLDRASAGEFADASARVELAGELLGGAQGEEILGRLFAEWIRYGRAGGQIKNAAPAYEGVRDDMVEETRRFIDRVVRVEGGSMRELLTSNQSELNTPLANFYGWGDASTPGFTTQTRPEHYSVGLLAQGSVLAGNAHADSSSPTQRGLLIHEKLLCNPGVAPPPDIPNIEPPEPGVITTRERYEIAHAGDAVCASCHAYFDPLGFASEHFDEAGRYRADEVGLAIDASGSVELESGRELSFDGLTQLAEGLADEVQVHACAGDNVERFAFGLEVQGCRDLALREAFVAEELGLAEYFVELAGSDAFVRRAGE